MIFSILRYISVSGALLAATVPGSVTANSPDGISGAFGVLLGEPPKGLDSKGFNLVDSAGGGDGLDQLWVRRDNSYFDQVYVFAKETGIYTIIARKSFKGKLAESACVSQMTGVWENVKLEHIALKEEDSSMSSGYDYHIGKRLSKTIPFFKKINRSISIRCFKFTISDETTTLALDYVVSQDELDDITERAHAAAAARAIRQHGLKPSEL